MEEYLMMMRTKNHPKIWSYPPPPQNIIWHISLQDYCLWDTLL